MNTVYCKAEECKYNVKGKCSNYNIVIDSLIQCCDYEEKEKRNENEK